MKLLAYTATGLTAAKVLRGLVSQSNAQLGSGNAAERDRNLSGWIQSPAKDRIATALQRCVKEAVGKSYEWAAMGRASWIGSGSLRR